MKANPAINPTIYPPRCPYWSTLLFPKLAIRLRKITRNTKHIIYNLTYLTGSR
jgi:hypothetical protein